MRALMVKRARILILYVALFCGMVFSAMTLTSNTAYAACNCTQIAYDVSQYCSVYGGIRYFYCDQSHYQFMCAFSSFFQGTC